MLMQYTYTTIYILDFQSFDLNLIVIFMKLHAGISFPHDIQIIIITSIWISI